jgi:hypothetical protein
MWTTTRETVMNTADYNSFGKSMLMHISWQENKKRTNMYFAGCSFLRI